MKVRWWNRLNGLRVLLTLTAACAVILLAAFSPSFANLSFAMALLLFSVLTRSGVYSQSMIERFEKWLCGPSNAAGTKATSPHPPGTKFK